MSALISGVKNFVSSGTSFVRGLPFSHVKLAKAKGCAFSGFTVPVAFIAIACGSTLAAVAVLVTPGDAGSGEAALGMAIRVEADEESELVGVDAETAAVGCTLPSS